MTPFLIFLNVLFYLLGCAVVILLRASWWLAKQKPEDATCKNFMARRFWTNVSSVCVAVFGTGIWVEGRILRWMSLEGESVTISLSLIAGGAVTLFARMIVKGLENFLAKRIGVSPDDEDE